MPPPPTFSNKLPLTPVYLFVAVTLVKNRVKIRTSEKFLTRSDPLKLPKALSRPDLWVDPTRGQL